MSCPWSSTVPASCLNALQKEARELISLLPRLTQLEWEKRLRSLFNRDPVMGPLATAYLLSQALKICSVEEAPFWQCQIDLCKRTAKISQKLHRANEAWGMTPYEVVHHKWPHALPRFNSEPTLSTLSPHKAGCQCRGTRSHDLGGSCTVSYTHLTLQTTYSVYF